MYGLGDGKCADCGNFRTIVPDGVVDDIVGGGDGGLLLGGGGGLFFQFTRMESMDVNSHSN